MVTSSNPTLSIMKALVFLFVIISLFSTDSTVKREAQEEFLFDKLLGKWQRTGKDTLTYELWKRESPTHYAGKGFRLNLQGDTVFQEGLKITISGGGIVYEADVRENPNPVSFKMTTSTSGSAIFENREHDFPKQITYTLKQDSLRVVISDFTRSIDFNFKRVSP